MKYCSWPWDHELPTCDAPLTKISNNNCSYSALLKKKKKKNPCWFGCFAPLHYKFSNCVQVCWLAPPWGRLCVLFSPSAKLFVLMLIMCEPGLLQNKALISCLQPCLYIPTITSQWARMPLCPLALSENSLHQVSQACQSTGQKRSKSILNLCDLLKRAFFKICCAWCHKGYLLLS